MSRKYAVNLEKRLYLWNKLTLDLKDNYYLEKLYDDIFKGHTFENLKADLAAGHEIEFSYKEETYSIERNDNGWHVAKFGEPDVQAFNDYNHLLHDALIDSRKLQDIWGDVKVEFVFKEGSL